MNNSFTKTFVDANWERDYDVMPFTNNVSSVPIVTSDGNDNRWKEIVVDNQTATLVPNSYPVISFPDVLQKIKPALNQFMDDYKGDYKIEDTVYKHGLVQKRSIKLLGTERQVDVGDTTSTEINITNSYDGSAMFRFQFGVKRLQCLNGMESLIPLINTTRKHCSRFAEQEFQITLPTPEELIQNQESADNICDLLKHISVPREDYHNMLKKTLCYTQFNENKVIESRFNDILQRGAMSVNNWDNDLWNGYTIFNALTHWATHTNYKINEYGEYTDSNPVNPLATQLQRNKEVKNFLEKTFLVYCYDKSGRVQF